MASVGERIRKARLMNGYTQSQLASKLGCTSNTVSRWELNKNVPSEKDMKLLTKILDADFSEDIPGSFPSMESGIEEIRLELMSARKVNKALVIALVVIVFFISLFLCWFVCGFQKIDPDAPNHPCTIIYYDVKEGEDIL